MGAVSETDGEEAPPVGVNDRQVGGSHYKRGDARQHWDFIDDHQIPYLEGCSTKYVTRHRYKGVAIQDLEKSLHYLDKIRARSKSRIKTYSYTVVRPTMLEMARYAEENYLNHHESIAMAATIEGLWDRDAYAVAETAIRHLLRVQKELGGSAPSGTSSQTDNSAREPLEPSDRYSVGEKIHIRGVANPCWFIGVGVVSGRIYATQLYPTRRTIHAPPEDVTPWRDGGQIMETQIMETGR